MIKYTIPKEIFERLYLEEKKGSKIISDSLGISRGRVKAYLKKYNIPMRKMHGGRDMALEGLVFGILTVIEPDKDFQKRRGLSNRNRYWKCQCECGNITYAVTNELRSGLAKSCGCLRCKSGPDSHNWKGHGKISSHFYQRIVNGAKERGIEMNVTIEEIWKLFQEQKGKCNLSGIDIKFADSHKENPTASLDRINSKIGYIEGNIQWVHKDVNKIKQNFDENYFIDLCKSISSYQINKFN